MSSHHITLGGFLTPGGRTKKKKENPEDALSLEEAVELKLAEGRMSISVFIHPINPPPNPPTGDLPPPHTHIYTIPVETIQHRENCIVDHGRRSNVQSDGHTLSYTLSKYALTLVSSTPLPLPSIHPVYPLLCPFLRFLPPPLSLPFKTSGTRRPAAVECHYYGATVEKEMSNREWLAHNDSVTSLVELQEHGCFLTVSLDGFHRVWNIDTDCLGEMPLPNLADAMRKAPFHKRPFGGWKFVLERIPVSEKHEEIANRFCEMIRRDAHLVKKEVIAPVTGLGGQHTHPINLPYQHALSIHPINQPYPYFLSLHPLSFQCIFSSPPPPLFAATSSACHLGHYNG